ncbi:MAG: hypothetical protein ACQESF_03655 [Nanobdellota archaeon]
MKYFCLGNEFVQEDSYAIKLCRIIKKQNPNLELIECQSSDEFLQNINDDKIIGIIDVVRGIKEVRIVRNHELKKSSNIINSHDFDINFFMNILKEIGIIKKIKIIGIPQQELQDTTIEKVKSLI